MATHDTASAASSALYVDKLPSSSATDNGSATPGAEQLAISGQGKDGQTSEEIPNGGYGWACVGTCFMINAHTWGMNSSYGVFLNYYLTTEAFPGATRLQYAFIGGLSMSLAMFISPLVTTSVRMLGTRNTLLIGVFFTTASFIAASFAKSIWQLALSQGACFALGLGFLFVGSVGVIPQWFSTRRSLANGLAAAGSGIGGLIYSLATNAMIESVGLPWAFRILGIVSFVVTFTCALLLKDRNKQVGTSQSAFDIQLLAKYEFWLVLGYGFFSMLGYVILIFSLPNYGHLVGLTASQSSILAAIVNLGQGLGRGPVGYFSDWIGRINMAGSMTFLSGVLALAVWINAKSYGVLIFYALVGGMVAGTYWATIAPVTAEVIDLKDLPPALSIVWVSLTFPLLFSEPIALEIVQFGDGSYLGAQIFCGVMYVAAALCLWLLRAWKLAQMQQKLDIDTAAVSQPGKSSFVQRLIAWRKV